MKVRLQIGDKIRVKGTIGVDHYGIYVGPRGGYGENIVHNDKAGGVRLVHLRDFSGGQPVIIEARVVNGRSAQETVAQRALSLLGTEYDLISFNCEHLANYAQLGIGFSPQLQQGVASLLVIAGAAWLLSE